MTPKSQSRYKKALITAMVAGVCACASLTRLAPGFQQVPELFDAYTREVGPVPLPVFLKALATAVARGWLLGV